MSTAVVGFARQHDCKRHMLLHEGLRPFECEGCGKKFARLDALTRHRELSARIRLTYVDKSEQGQECAVAFPLPTNRDGTAMSESQYKLYRQYQAATKMAGAGVGGGLKREPSFSGYPSGEEEMGLGNGSGMDEYDRF